MPRTTRVTPPHSPVIDYDSLMFTRIFCIACIAGFVAGLLLTAVEQWQVVPLMRSAEALEAEAGHRESVSPAAWQPHGVWERMGAAAMANIVLGVGFALILVGASTLRGSGGWRAGLLWGVAGYAVFFVAPSLGLPPELPGTAAASLVPRTLWWLLTVSCSAAGLWLVVFARPASLRAVGIALLVGPHVIGAPRPEVAEAVASHQLTEQFSRAAYVSNAIFWLVLGTLVGLASKAGMHDARNPNGFNS